MSLNLFFEGFFLQASLIFALGAQNLFVLEEGIRKKYFLSVSLVCFLCDFLLIMLGVAGAATLFTKFSQLKIIIGIVGVAFLFHYGWSKLFARTDVFSLSDTASQRSWGRTLMLAVTFSVLNPHAYLDAFILIGGYSAKYDLLDQRLTLGLGAAIFSGIWFVTISGASSVMAPLLSDPRRMRYVMATSGVVLMLLSLKLGADVVSWITDGPHSALALSGIPYPMPPSSIFTSILY
jgi:L-lysine exporter family protein LysE/ArgO